MSGEYNGWIRTSLSGCNSFYLVIKENMWSYVILMEDYAFPVPDDFGSSTYWNESFGFLEGVHSKGFPFNSTIYAPSPLDEDWALV